MSYMMIWLLTTLGAITAAFLHSSPDAPAICYGIVIGSAMVLLVHWRFNLK